MDSGAEESARPWEWGKQFGVESPEGVLNFVNASGGPTHHYGGREVVVVPF